MNQWQPIETYLKPTEVYDYNHPEILIYSPTQGIRQVRCIKEYEYCGEGDSDRVRDYHNFRYDREGIRVSDATHWMPLPEAPTVESLPATPTMP